MASDRRRGDVAEAPAFTGIAGMAGIVVAACLAGAPPALAQQPAERLSPPAVNGAGAAACVTQAALMHHVNASLLAAILAVESGFNSRAVNVNADRSVDVGIAGINSVHFDALAKVGVAPADLLDPCKSTYVAAWFVSQNLRRYGNTWYGYAAFHSKTPYYNHRYQILLANELIRKGVVVGPILPVPPLRVAQ
jgi:soluble lytic murein transglycosylase-like protein